MLVVVEVVDRRMTKNPSVQCAVSSECNYSPKLKVRQESQSAVGEIVAPRF